MPNDEPTELGVVHCDPFTGIVFDPSPPFDKYNCRPKPTSIPFESRDDAIQYCKSIVAQYPHLQCTLEGDLTGNGFVLDDPEWIEQESQRRRSQQLSHAEQDRSARFAIIVALILVLAVGFASYVILW